MTEHYDDDHPCDDTRPIRVIVEPFIVPPLYAPYGDREERRAMMLYFGCWSAEKLGHYLYTESGRPVFTRERCPFYGDELDARLAPNELGLQVEGHAQLVHVKQWTILAFWDRSADHRRGSNSAFLLDHPSATPEEMLLAASLRFPAQSRRFSFRIEVVREMSLSQ